MTGIEKLDRPCRHCKSQEVRLRRRTLRDGSQQYLGQCQRCGQPTQAIAAAQALAAAAGQEVPEFQEGIRREYQDHEQAASPELFSASHADRAEWYARYHEHLASEKWAGLRVKVMNRAGGVCEGCADAPATAVHHLTYKHLGDEFLWELVAICEECHERCHPHMRPAQ